MAFSLNAVSDETLPQTIQLRNEPNLTNLVHAKNSMLLEVQQTDKNTEALKRGSLFWSKHEIDGFGIWVEAEGPRQPLNDENELRRLEAVIKESPVKDIYVQVYRNGRSWFPSQYADDEPYRIVSKNGLDPLRVIINAAHEKEEPAKVHIWLNALRLGNDRNAKVLKFLGREAALLSSRGESLYDTAGYGNVGCRPDTPGIWLDASNKTVSTLLLNLLLEVTTRYPEIDGIHLDMIRRPFPYSATEPKAEGCVKFLSKIEYENQYLKKSQVSGVGDFAISRNDLGPTVIIKKFRRVVDRIFPDLELSAAVISNQNMAVNHAFQDWPTWITDDLIDSVVTMTYTNDFERFRREVLAAKDLAPEKISIGVGAWLALGSPQMLVDQVRFVKENGLDGVVLFSHGNLANQRGAMLYRKLEEVLRD